MLHGRARGASPLARRPLRRHLRPPGYALESVSVLLLLSEARVVVAGPLACGRRRRYTSPCISRAAGEIELDDCLSRLVYLG